MEEEESTEPSSDAEQDAPSAPAATEPRAASATPRPRGETRYPLAYDANGNPIVLPTSAVAWRVRRGGGRRGRPRNVFDPLTGRQLEIALGASIEDLAETHIAPDRYLLYPIDREGCILPGLVAVTELTDDADAEFVDEEEERRTITTHSREPELAFCAEQRATIDTLTELVKTQVVSMTNVVNTALSGYGRVRALPAPELAPAPMVIEAGPPAGPVPPSAGTLLATAFIDLIKNSAGLAHIVMMAQQMMAAAAGASGAVPDVSAPPPMGGP